MDTNKLLEEFISLVRETSKSALGQTFSLTGKQIRRKMGITPFQLGKLKKELEKRIKNRELRGVRIETKSKNRIRIYFEKSYWLPSEE